MLSNGENGRVEPEASHWSVREKIEIEDGEIPVRNNATVQHLDRGKGGGASSKPDVGDGEWAHKVFQFQGTHL